MPPLKGDVFHPLKYSFICVLSSPAYAIVINKKITEEVLFLSQFIFLLYIFVLFIDFDTMKENCYCQN